MYRNKHTLAMSKKYKLLKSDTIKVSGRTLYRIVALRSFGSVKKGDLGGYIEGENSLSHYHNAWVGGDAQVYGDAEVVGNAEVCWFSKVGSEGGTLTAFKTKTGIGVTRGCFCGTLQKFEQAVKAKHGTTQIGEEYQLLIKFIKLRLSK